MSIYGNNKIANRVRKFLVNNSNSFSTTAENYAAVVFESGRIVFIDRETGKIVGTN
jgi:hypothetical protein